MGEPDAFHQEITDIDEQEREREYERYRLWLQAVRDSVRRGESRDRLRRALEQQR